MKTSSCTIFKLDSRTSLSIFVNREDDDPTQMDLFTDIKGIWMDDVMKIAKKLPAPFFFSELRTYVAHEPPSSKWWGSVTKKMKAQGFVQTGTYRRSPRKSRKGGTDFQWDRKSTKVATNVPVGTRSLPLGADNNELFAIVFLNLL